MTQGGAGVAGGAAAVTLASLAASAFVATLILTRAGLTRPLDEQVSAFLDRHSSALFDGLAGADSIVGDSVVTGVVALGLSAALLARGAGIWSAAPLLIFAVSGLELASKMSLLHPPPPQGYVRAAAHILRTGTDTGLVSSFPSGHVARLAFLAVVITAMTRSVAVAVALAALTALTMIARVYLGDHWTSDTVGGLLLGIAVGAVAAIRIGRPNGRSERPDRQARWTS